MFTGHFVGYILLVTCNVSFWAIFSTILCPMQVIKSKLSSIYKVTIGNLNLQWSTKYHDYWMFGWEVIAGDANF